MQSQETSEDCATIAFTTPSRPYQIPSHNLAISGGGPGGLAFGASPYGGGMGTVAGGGGVGGGGATLATGAPIEFSSAPSSSHQNAAAAGAVAWFNKTSVRHFMRICSVASLLSVCANTSRTFSWYPTLMLITFIVDIITGIVFTIEIVFKIYSRGLFNGPSPYAKDRWCQFDATMVFFIWISILLQVSKLEAIPKSEEALQHELRTMVDQEQQH